MRAIATPLAFLALLTGCAAESTTNAPTTPASSPTAAQQTQSPQPTTATAPAQLKAEQTITTPQGDVTVTAAAYRQPLPTEFPPDRSGYVFAGLDAKLCVPSTGPVSWGPWSLTFSDDTVIDPVSAWSDEWFSVPLYPGFDKVVQAGRCVRGWILFEVPKGKRPVMATYAPTLEDGSRVVEWQIGGLGAPLACLPAPDEVDLGSRPSGGLDDLRDEAAGAFLSGRGQCLADLLEEFGADLVACGFGFVELVAQLADAREALFGGGCGHVPSIAQDLGKADMPTPLTCIGPLHSL